MSRWSYDVTDVYNVFGAGHNYRVTLYKDGKWKRYWDIDDFIPGWRWRLKRRIKDIESVYGATRK